MEFKMMSVRKCYQHFLVQLLSVNISLLICKFPLARPPESVHIYSINT